MAARLGAECRQRREAAGFHQIDIQVHARVSAGTVSHFERGDWWLRETDRIVAAYAVLLGVDAREIWHAAIDRE